MIYPIEVTMPNGAVSLGPDVVCDGFLSDAKIRAQTHVHLDHMYHFETSKGNQRIVTSEATRGLLIAELNADLPYRSNIIPLKHFQPFEFDGTKVSLAPSGHMLGSVQVTAELPEGMRLGYSGDFQWPLENVIQVDALVVDSTYGSPENIREFSQGECEEQFVGLLNRLITIGPVVIKAHRGTLQRALQLINDEIGCPVIGTQRLSKELDVYRKFGYSIGPIVIDSSYEAQEISKGNRHVQVYGTGDHAPVDLGTASKIVLSAYFTRPDSPITEYSARSFGVAMSNHADFLGTLEYVRATNAKFVVTDNTRSGKGHILATELKQRLGITARPSSSVRNREWGA